jgi:C1A family cysteine protease
MRKILITLTLLLITFNLSNCFSRELYEEIKAKAPFQVMDFEEHQKIFAGRTYEDFSVWNGENKLFSPEAFALLEETKAKSFLDADIKVTGIALPTEFDWRNVKPECFSPIKNQAFCGGCYSFSATAALETRMCIASKGRVAVELSQQDIISCDANNHKCQGDRLDNTWKFLEREGTVSFQCKPYESANGYVPPCRRTCKNLFNKYVKYKARAGSWRFLTSIEEIKTEIITNGPISAGMATFEDFSFYKGDIYIHTTGRQTDHHAVVILGWGYDARYNSEYWILRNSWGEDWGERGYFKILFGNYEVNNMCNASLPMV